MKRICVLGLGNLMRVDDAAGMMAVSALAAEYGADGDVAFVEGGTLGLDLMHALTGVTHLLALDAVDVGGEPGTLVRFEKEELGRIPVGKSAHLLGFSDLMGVLKLMGDEPEEIVLLGVQPERIDWGTELTDAVQKAMPAWLAECRLQLEAWGAGGGQGSEALGVSVHA